MGKGLTFGELALIDGQTPAAHIVAESELACYGIAVDALRAFASSCHMRQDPHECHPGSG